MIGKEQRCHLFKQLISELADKRVSVIRVSVDEVH